MFMLTHLIMDLNFTTLFVTIFPAESEPEVISKNCVNVKNCHICMWCVLHTSDGLLEILKLPYLVFMESHGKHGYHISVVRALYRGQL